MTITDPSAPFGTKATAAPYWYQNFDSLAVGDKSLQAGLQAPVNKAYPWVADDMAYSGSNSLKWIYETANSDTFFPEAGFLWTEGVTAVYQSSWINFGVVSGTLSASFGFDSIKMNYMGGLTGTSGPLADPSEVTPAEYYYHGSPRTETNFRVYSATQLVTSDWCFRYNYAGDSFYSAYPKGFANVGTQQYYINVGEWTFLEVAYTMSNPAGAPNGLCWIALNGVSIFNPPFQVGGSTTPYPTGVTAQAGYPSSIGWVITPFTGWGSTVAEGEAAGSPEYGLWCDEMYVDQSVQRVVMTNNAVYGDSTLFANQLPTSWAEDKIVSTVNSPHFTGQTVYFHVFGPAGNEVGVYEAALAPVPNAPTHVRTKSS